MAADTRTLEELATAAVDARNAFITATAALTTGQRDDPNLVGEWSLRQITAHLGYWVGLVAEALHHAEQGRAAEFGEDGRSVDERNEIVARVALDASLASVQAREEASFGAMLDRLRQADPEWLQQATADGTTIAAMIQEEGADHYREHAAELNVALQGPPA